MSNERKPADKPPVDPEEVERIPEKPVDPAPASGGTPPPPPPPPHK